MAVANGLIPIAAFGLNATWNMAIFAETFRNQANTRKLHP
jgi:hypothetical protein